jgi:hypothetical protein
MKRVLATAAVLALLAVPMWAVANEGDTPIPPEANWTPYPPTPAVVASPEKREVRTPQELSDVRPASQTAAQPEKAKGRQFRAIPNTQFRDIGMDEGD